jgi:multidrug resistance efflux pump
MIIPAMMKYALLGALIALPAFGQEQAIQRELIVRQQQSDAFTLQLRQSQQQLQIPPGDFRRRVELEASQLRQRQELDNLSARQLTEAGRDTPAELRPLERLKFEEQRRALLTAQQASNTGEVR